LYAKQLVCGGGARTFIAKRRFLLSSTLSVFDRSTPSSRNFSSTGAGSLSSSIDETGSRYRVFLGAGSNLGIRDLHIRRGVQLLCSEGDVELVRTSFFYQTAPMYVEDQPAFLNAAVEIETTLEPHALLRRVKDVEESLGRNFSEIRNGPRPLDLDILLYDHSASGNSIEIDSTDLKVPHPGIQERDFVLKPLSEISGSQYVHPLINQTIAELHDLLPKSKNPPVRVLPLSRNRTILFNETIIMGILNVTPDSFSDGGRWDVNVKAAVDRALRMEREGAAIVDIGGESTRPGAAEVAIDEELHRTIPVIKKIREVSDIPLSIDTRHAKVARAAIEAGADIVNDISGGLHDPKMLETVAELGVPVILMHMRGTPRTMQSMTEYDDVVKDVSNKLQERIRAAEKAGIPRWLQVADPGIGFAKDLAGNLLLLKNLKKIRSMVNDVPILIGTSRKGFIGKLTGTDQADQRDFGTVASMVGPLCLEGGELTCTILRVHNVEAARQATKIMDALKSA